MPPIAAKPVYLPINLMAPLADSAMILAIHALGILLLVSHAKDHFHTLLIADHASVAIKTAALNAQHPMVRFVCNVWMDSISIMEFVNYAPRDALNVMLMELATIVARKLPSSMDNVLPVALPVSSARAWIQKSAQNA